MGAALIRELEYVESSLSHHERHDTRAALNRYQAAVMNVLRALFDEAEKTRRIAESAEDRRCMRCGEPYGERANFCTGCCLPLSDEGKRHAVAEIISWSGGHRGRYSNEGIIERVEKMEQEKPGAFLGALNAYIHATGDRPSAAR